MVHKNPVVVITRKLPESIEARMMELFDTHLSANDVPLSQDDLCTVFQQADVVVPTVTDNIDRNIIEAAGPQLKLIANFGTGIDHIDIEAAKHKGIIVTNTPGVLTEDTADMTMALILASARRIIEGAIMIREGRWKGWSPTLLLGRRLGGKRLGIIGMGRIGQAVAQRARGFGLSIHYHNRKRVHPEIESELEATYWESLDQMLARMDIVSVNCPHTPATYHLLSARRLNLLQPHALLINTARGEIIDETAMVKLLSEGKISSAGLDVYEHEPDINAELLTLSKPVLLPHVASATLEGRIAMGERVLVNVKSFIDGHTPPDLIVEAP